MKIIHEGTKNWQKDPIRFHCPRCKCIFEAENDEYTKEAVYSNAVFDYLVRCPNCGIVVIETVNEERRR